MVREGSVLLSPGCPGRDDLDDFARGLLPPEKREAIAEHLSQCVHCESSLEALHADETILNHLRREPAHVFLLNEPACGQLEARARAIPQEHPDTPTVSDIESDKSVAEGPPLPIAFGAYLLLERLGQGGMGIVYKARQETLKRLVALKLVRAGIYASPEERARFQREGESVARVQHRHVVQIHEFGEHDGQPFFSMELLEGGTLTSKLNRQPLPEREAAELLRTLAWAVHAAHQQGVVHRDLKPGNVLLAVDGTVKITDFGLAKMLDAEDSDTRSDAILGTPAYMAPEQARGESRTIGVAADVYALGAILYETLTGRPPFRAETRYQTLELARTGEPEAPSKLQRRLSRDLEAVCLKCLEKEPAKRYASAEALADDLDRWLRGESPLVRPPTSLQRGWRTVRRHPRIAVVLALFFTLALAIPATFWYRDPERPLKRIEEELARGQSRTLIGDTSPPAWSHWRLGRDSSTTTSLAEEPFAVHAPDIALLELLRDPQQTSFRFRAEVRHERGDYDAGVGLYVAHQQYPSETSPVHYYTMLAFDDINDLLIRHRALVQQFGIPQPTGNVVEFCPCLSWDEGLWSSPIYKLAGRSRQMFRAAGPGPKPWRPLCLEVRPQGIRAFWDKELVGNISADKLTAGVQHSLHQTREEEPDNLPYRGFTPDFNPRRGLGLFVYRGSASFRRVVLELLEPSP